jgi:hypothetical protein
MKLCMCPCSSGHFFVITMVFDPTSTTGDFFQDVKIFDSLKRPTTRTINTRHFNKCPATEFLQKFQLFVRKFILYDSDIATVYLSDKQHILQNIDYVECPQQENLSDCSLFAVAVVFHTINDRTVHKNIFSQKDITYFRKGLYKILSAETNFIIGETKKFVSRQFLLSFFPELNFASVKKDPFIYYLHFGQDYPDLDNITASKSEETETTESEYEYLSSNTSGDTEDSTDAEFNSMLLNSVFTSNKGNSKVTPSQQQKKKDVSTTEEEFMKLLERGDSKNSNEDEEDNDC